MLEFGPFFVAERHPAGAEPAAPWLRFSDLIEQPDVLAARVAQVRLALAAGRPAGTVELKVAASVAQLGLIARLLSPALGSEALGLGRASSARETWWQPALGGAFPLSLTNESGSAGDVLDGPVTELTEVVLARFEVSEKVLRGNIASAVHAAAGIVGRQRPELAVRARSVAAGLLDRPTLTPTFEVRQGRFVRRSCCLIYRIAPDGRAAVCGDCVLAP